MEVSQKFIKYRDNVGNESNLERDEDEFKDDFKTDQSIESHVDRNLRHSNTANSLLGLSVVLNGNRKQYSNWPVWNLALNNYYGFKVITVSNVIIN